MKILSKTDRNGRVVELTEGEFYELSLLASALEGKEERQAHWDFINSEQHKLPQIASVDETINFEGVFGAIKAFRDAKFRLNELTSLVQRFGVYLERDKSTLVKS